MERSDHILYLFSILPHVPHFLKACKTNFANLYLQLNNEGGCLLLLYTLRNRADPKVWKYLKIYLNLWCALRSLTTSHGTQPPTIHKLDLDHGFFCGNQVHYGGE